MKKLEFILLSLLAACSPVTEKIESNNKNILMSIALGYRLKGDKSNSLIYFEKMLKLDDQNSVDFAKQQINLLN